MKVTINSIYDDNKTIFSQNPLISADSRLSEIVSMANDLDLVCEMDFGAREILRRNIKNDDDEVFVYDLTKINRHVYAVLVENMPKYLAMINSINQMNEYDPSYSYYEEYVKGENSQTREYGSRVNTNSYGNINTTHNVGATSQTVQNGARENTSSVSAFSTNTFNSTDKTASAQATDTTNFGAQTNSEQVTRANDTTTQGSHLDKITNDETTDTKRGVRDYVDNIERYRNFFDKSVLKTIVTDCVNAITYSMYL